MEYRYIAPRHEYSRQGNRSRLLLLKKERGLRPLAKKVISPENHTENFRPYNLAKPAPHFLEDNSSTLGIYFKTLTKFSLERTATRK